MTRNLAQSGGARKFRVHDRKTVRLQVSVTHVGAGWVRGARVQNLGLGGVCFEIDEDIATGDRLLLSFVARSMGSARHSLARGLVAASHVS